MTFTEQEAFFILEVLNAGNHPGSLIPTLFQIVQKLNSLDKTLDSNEIALLLTIFTSFNFPGSRVKEAYHLMDLFENGRFTFPNDQESSTNTKEK